MTKDKLKTAIISEIEENVYTNRYEHLQGISDATEAIMNIVVGERMMTPKEYFADERRDWDITVPITLAEKVCDE